MKPRTRENQFVFFHFLGTKPVAHQYELLKLPNVEWNYLIQHTRKWAESARPMPKGLKWVPYYESGKYDLAVLHVDQQCLIPKLGKSKVFAQMRAQINDIPIIVLNHGTPVYPEVFMEMAEREGYRSNEESAEQWAKDKMKELLSGIDEMVVNSHEAQKMWGWGRAIIHGMQADEWYDLPKEPRCVTVISPAGIGEKYYGRRFFNEVRNIVKEKYETDMVWIGEKGEFAPSWDAYKKFLGRSLVYFNPTIGSPMPRSRTEAMLSGACVITTKFQDADTFIKDGVNGFLCRLNPTDAADKIGWCLEHYQETIKIGQEGKKTAIELFNKQRFQDDWKKLLDDVLTKR